MCTCILFLNYFCILSDFILFSHRKCLLLLHQFTTEIRIWSHWLSKNRVFGAPTARNNLWVRSQVSWHRNNEQLLEGERFHFVHEGNFFCVDVAPVTMEDGGRWTCMAEGAGGRASCSSHLNVLGKWHRTARQLLRLLKGRRLLPSVEEFLSITTLNPQPRRETFGASTIPV